MILKLRCKVRHFSLVPAREVQRVIVCTSHLAEFHASTGFSACNFRRNITRRHGAVRDCVANTQTLINFCHPINIATSSCVNKHFPRYERQCIVRRSISEKRFLIFITFHYLWFYTITQICKIISVRVTRKEIAQLK